MCWAVWYVVYARGQSALHFVAGTRRAQVLAICDLEFTLQFWGLGFKVQDFGVQAKAGKRRQMMYHVGMHQMSCIVSHVYIQAHHIWNTSTSHILYHISYVLAGMLHPPRSLSFLHSQAGPRLLTLTMHDVHVAAGCEQRGHTLKPFKGFNLKAKAGIWP